MASKNTTAPVSEPMPTFELKDAVALVVGIVLGVGIFKLPALVAGNAGSPALMFAAWALGGAISIIGALCYAELATAFPSAGGEYHFLARAFGARLAFVFAWARMTVIVSGSIALLAFVLGDYASQLLPLGEYSSSIYAALAVLALTGINIIGIREGKATQNWLTILEVLGLVIVVVAGLLVAAPAQAQSAPSGGDPGGGAFGLAMVFVLLTYGGWNEAAYVSAEIKDKNRNMVRSLVYGLLLVTVLYLLVVFAYYQGLGMAGMEKSQVVAADLLKNVWGEPSAKLISIMICISAITSINATILTGARTNYALGRDWPMFRVLSLWDGRRGSPTHALLAQGGIALALILLGTATRKGFETMVDYTAPVFWFFFLMTGISLFVLRRREPAAARPFRVPFYPVTPLLFCATCIYLLYSSLAYTKEGALFGVGVLAVGALLLFFQPGKPTTE